MAGLYHLLTHGAFKALLFLGCGSVILAVHHEQDMRRMGGLKERMPITYWTFVIGSLALGRLSLDRGLFSKDALLLGCVERRNVGPSSHGAGYPDRGLTAFYSFRLVFVAFWGESRADPRGRGPRP